MDLDNQNNGVDSHMAEFKTNETNETNEQIRHSNQTGEDDVYYRDDLVDVNPREGMILITPGNVRVPKACYVIENGNSYRFTDKYQYACNWCDRVFQGRSMKKHISNKHSKVTMDEILSLYQAPQSQRCH